jgi:hypothetical protein
VGEQAQQARQRVVEARAALADEVDDLGSAARTTFDIPATVRANPVQTAGLAGGAVFLAVGGPKKLIQGVRRAMRRGKPPRAKGLLPKEIERAVDALGEDGPYVKARLEREFASYIQDKKKNKQLEPTAQQSFWRLFDIMAGPLGTQAARKLAEQLLQTPPPTTSGAADATRPPTRRT